MSTCNIIVQQEAVNEPAVESCEHVVPFALAGVRSSKLQKAQCSGIVHAASRLR